MLRNKDTFMALAVYAPFLLLPAAASANSYPAQPYVDVQVDGRTDTIAPLPPLGARPPVSEKTYPVKPDTDNPDIVPSRKAEDEDKNAKLPIQETANPDGTVDNPLPQPVKRY